MIAKGKEVGIHHDFLALARRINSSMPFYVVSLLQDALNDLGYSIKNTKVCLLGISYKPDIADDRETPAYEVIKELKRLGADLAIYDPYFAEKSTHDSLEEALNGAVCAVLVTAHRAFVEEPAVYGKLKLIVDGRNCLDPDRVDEMGIVYRGVGIN
jgi:UDP-N-acetyl-D-glucosamine dehydrogenase